MLIYVKIIKKKLFIRTDGRTNVQLKTIVRNLTKQYKNRIKLIKQLEYKNKNGKFLRNMHIMFHPCHIQIFECDTSGTILKILFECDTGGTLYAFFF